MSVPLCIPKAHQILSLKTKDCIPKVLDKGFVPCIVSLFGVQNFNQETEPVILSTSPLERKHATISWGNSTCCRVVFAAPWLSSQSWDRVSLVCSPLYRWLKGFVNLSWYNFTHCQECQGTPLTLNSNGIGNLFPEKWCPQQIANANGTGNFRNFRTTNMFLFVKKLHGCFKTHLSSDRMHPRAEPFDRNVCANSMTLGLSKWVMGIIFGNYKRRKYHLMRTNGGIRSCGKFSSLPKMVLKSWSKT